MDKPTLYVVAGTNGSGKSPMIGKSGTDRVSDLNPEVITTSVAKKVTKKIYVVEYPDKVKTSTGTGGVFDDTTHDGDYMPFETPTFFSLQHD